MIGSLFSGITQASRNWKMISLLWIVNLLCSLPIAALIFLLIIQTVSGTLAANKLLADKIDANWMIDLFNQQLPGVSLESGALQVLTLLVVMGSSYLLLNTFLVGGILEVFTSGDGRFTMRRFWS